MRLLFTLIVTAVLLSACKKETLAPVIDLMENADTTAVAIKQGSFMNGPYGTVSGNAILYRKPDGKFEIKLDGFNTTNGPDLYVYLSREIMPVNFIEIEKLRSTTGDQVYAVTTTVDISDYKYVCIHCKEFNHLFGHALLQ